MGGNSDELKSLYTGTRLRLRSAIRNVVFRTEAGFDRRITGGWPVVTSVPTEARRGNSGGLCHWLTGILAVIACQAPARATDYTWNNPAGGDYNLGTNWIGGVGGVPPAAGNGFFHTL